MEESLSESGTEPVVRVMVEAETTEICQEMVNKVVVVIREKVVKILA